MLTHLTTFLVFFICALLKASFYPVIQLNFFLSVTVLSPSIIFHHSFVQLPEDMEMESCFLLKPTRNENTQCLEVVDFVGTESWCCKTPKGSNEFKIAKLLVESSRCLDLLANGECLWIFCEILLGRCGVSY